jgi:hypothetical protein
MKFEPVDLLVWLSRVDVNGLSDADADKIASIDIEKEQGLRELITGWLRPWFAENDPQNQRELKGILEASEHWSDKKIRAMFDEISLPSGQRVNDPARFLAALREEFIQ